MVVESRKTSSYGLGMAFTQNILVREYLRRKEKNPSYSLRAFARFLEIPPGRLSELISGKRRATHQIIVRLADKLAMQDGDTKEWIVTNEKERQQKKQGNVFHELNPQEIEILSDGMHFHLMALMKLPNFQSRADWMADRLGVSRQKVEEALERLLKARLISVEPNGDYVVVNKAMTTTHEIASEAIRHAHRQFLGAAAESLNKHAVELRDISSICMPTNPELLSKAKDRIAKFRREMAEIVMADPNRCTEVYRLNIQLYPVTVPKTEQEIRSNQ